jgi:excisionase family DNA binding protein
MWVSEHQWHSTEVYVRTVSKQKLLGVEEVAGRLGVTQRYVRRLVAERRIRFIKVGHLLRFEGSDLDDWIEQNCTEPIEAMSLRIPSSSGPSTATKGERPPL